MQNLVVGLQHIIMVVNCQTINKTPPNPRGFGGLEESKIQAERDTKLDEIATNKLLKDNCSSISKNNSFKNNSELSADNISSLQEQLKTAEDKSKSVLDSLDKFSSNSDFSSNKENLHKEVSGMLSATEKINKLLDGFSKGSGEGNNFMPSLNVYMTILTI